MIFIYSRIFHFVTRDYFRYRDESSDESDLCDDDDEHGDYIVGGIYSPPVLSKVKNDEPLVLK